MLATYGEILAPFGVDGNADSAHKVKNVLKNMILCLMPQHQALLGCHGISTNFIPTLMRKRHRSLMLW